MHTWSLPALKAKISNVKQEEDGKAEAPAHLLRLLKPAIPPNPTPAAVATYDSDEMLQLWLALRAVSSLLCPVWCQNQLMKLSVECSRSSTVAPRGSTLGRSYP
jgi:hypothetical protein